MFSHGKTASGFSLLELLIVTAVIAIIVAIAVPSLQGSKKAAYEATAIQYLRSWSSAQELYHQRYGFYADADNQLVAEGLVGNPDPDRLGYIYSIDSAPGARAEWWGRAWPKNPGVTGDRYFFIDHTGVIRFSLSGNANATSPPIGSGGGS